MQGKSFILYYPCGFQKHILTELDAAALYLLNLLSTALQQPWEEATHFEIVPSLLLETTNLILIMYG